MKQLSAVLLFIVCTLSAIAQDITSGLIAHYTFENNTNDQSGNGNHATAAGSYQYVRSLVGNGIRLFGDDSLIYAGGGHVLLPNLSPVLNNGFTISFWVRDEVVGSNNDTNGECYISFGIGDQPSCGISLEGAAKRVLFFINNGLGGPSYDIVRTIDFASELSTWRHIVLTYSPGKMTAYFNGAKIGEGAITVNVFPVTKAALGRHWWSNGNLSSARMSALYDNLRIYSRALSSNDVRELNSVDKLATSGGVLPSIFNGPENRVVEPGESVTFQVSATGSAPLAFQWAKNGEPIPGANNATFTITDVKPADAGSYSVTVSNATGSLLSSSAILTVRTIGKLVNISTRGQVGQGGNILIVGFNINGAKPVKVLIRGVGPGIAAFGISNALSDPQITLYKDQTIIDSNDNWDADPGKSAIIRSASAAVAGLPLFPNSRDAALVTTLPPGAYTVFVTGVNGVTGVALAEVYEVP